jgi:hypothetical protein
MAADIDLELKQDVGARQGEDNLVPQPHDPHGDAGHTELHGNAIQMSRGMLTEIVLMQHPVGKR